MLRGLIQNRLSQPLREGFSADDILQEVWLRVFRKIGTYIPNGPDSFDRWLSSVATKCIISLVKRVTCPRRGGGRPAIREQWDPGSSYIALMNDLAGQGPTPSREAFAVEAAQFVRSALSSLSPDRQRAVSMRYLEGRSFEEIAQETGRSKLAVRTLVRRGIEQMREHLGHSSDFFTDAATTVGN